MMVSSSRKTSVFPCSQVGKSTCRRLIKISGLRFCWTAQIDDEKLDSILFLPLLAFTSSLPLL